MKASPASPLFTLLRRHGAAAAVLVALFVASLPTLRIYGAELTAGDPFWRALLCLSVDQTDDQTASGDQTDPSRSHAVGDCDDCLACVGASLAAASIESFTFAPTFFALVDGAPDSVDAPRTTSWRTPPVRGPPLG